MSVKWTRRSGEPAVATVDASGSPESVVLTRVPTGDTLVVRRVDASANAVTVSVASGLTLNGNPAGTVAVPAGGEAQLLSLDAGFVSFQTSGGGGGAVASVVGVTGVVTGAQIAADPAFTGTYAPKANPTFTGTVAVPTPTAAAAATPKSYVDAAVASATAGGYVDGGAPDSTYGGMTAINGGTP